ncbi:MarR family winged helix-turn-helix transcriptional regulator [Phaeacidiphilus oryzae]|jgi:DNA-binding MarR family transcriptional regulator|uniref:MarR family winged helix-turn-helix transcriptional regulator n=1 Tax=Phaeacidiphilus oryzae TaxID=348818 RepID=UPI00055F4B2A|nr:helix-turn-helix domain-containing protein [Phaeacidiphilus oryzae]
MDDEALAEELRQTIGELVRAVRAADTMSPGEAAILGHLDRGGPHTTADLAQLRGVTHQAAAKSVKELLGDGLVRAEPHPTDGRKLLLHITETGRARLTRERAQRADWLNTAIRTALDPAEQQQLRRCVPLLARLTSAITGR